MKKIKTGILGLDGLLDGGFNEHSASILVGSAGTGKTTMALQFLRKGLEQGNEAIYITLEEARDQIMAEAKSMGWEDVGTYAEDGSLVFLEAAGKDLADFIKEELPQFVDDWRGSRARIVIDPLTPVIWAFENKYEQRMLVSQLFKETKKVGTVLGTIEEYGGENGEETAIPMYLADTVVRMFPVQGTSNRMVEILKSRQSWHSETNYPYRFILGIGVVVDNQGLDGKHTSKLTPEQKKKLYDYAAGLSKRDAERVKGITRFLEDADIGDMTMDQILDMFLQDIRHDEKPEEKPGERREEKPGERKEEKHLPNPPQ